MIKEKWWLYLKNWMKLTKDCFISSLSWFICQVKQYHSTLHIIGIFENETIPSGIYLYMYQLFKQGKIICLRIVYVLSSDIDMGIKGTSIVYLELSHFWERERKIEREREREVNFAIILECIYYVMVVVYVIGWSFIYNFKHGNSSSFVNKIKRTIEGYTFDLSCFDFEVKVVRFRKVRFFIPNFC